MVTIKRYNPQAKAEWDNFVRQTRNATFLHERAYMDYHSDRFADFSLMAYDKNRLIAVLPANVAGDTVYSHQGLTYGGWLTSIKHVSVLVMQEIFIQMRDFLVQNNISHLVYKPVPTIYHSYPAQEDLYALFHAGAKQTVCMLSSSINLSAPLKFNENARRAVKAARESGVIVKESNDWKDYWNILTELLAQRYNSKPVHTLSEMLNLKENFSDQIRLFCAYDANNEMVAGVVMYFTKQVAHTQYIAASKRGKELKALPLLFEHIIANVPAGTKYFDFGTSSENGGATLNEGLISQKVGMGGRGVVHSTFVIDFNL